VCARDSGVWAHRWDLGDGWEWACGWGGQLGRSVRVTPLLDSCLGAGAVGTSLPHREFQNRCSAAAPAAGSWIIHQ